MNKWRKWIGVLVVILVGVVASRTTAVSGFLNQAQPAGGAPRVYLPLIRSSCDEYFLDDFSNPNSGWPVGPVVLNGQQLGATSYVNGEYLIHSDAAGAGYLFRPLAPAPGPENYTVEAEARFDAPTVDGLVGLIFGAIIEGSEVPRYYLFEIEPETQEFRLIRREYSVSTDIVDYTLSTAINPGTGSNHLSVTRQGDQITLAINGAMLGAWSDSGITGPGYTGLALRVRTSVLQANAYYDNFHLYDCAPTGSVATFSGAARPSVVDTFGAFEE
ncbi:MAG TPA: hypothetical protein PLD25_07610 [Chloroflexota bacterium]|nr:hypothetical protein [Chloroflexota bacterium]